jgi:predicted O-methyltransferase YrrM
MPNRSRLRHAALHLIQYLNRHIGTAYRESIYQGSYLDLARRIDWLDTIPLASPSGGTANFSFLYTLLSILSDQGPSSILEIGAGQSTILLAQYARRWGRALTVVDHEKYWLQTVTEFPAGCSFIHAPLTPMSVKNRTILWYDCDAPASTFDLLLIDGPPASTRALRYHRLGILRWLPKILQSEFLIIADDASRPGERVLVRHIDAVLRQHGIAFQTRDIWGASTQTLFVTDTFRRYLYL